MGAVAQELDHPVSDEGVAGAALIAAVVRIAVVADMAIWGLGLAGNVMPAADQQGGGEGRALSIAVPAPAWAAIGRADIEDMGIVASGAGNQNLPVCIDTRLRQAIIL